MTVMFIFEGILLTSVGGLGIIGNLTAIVVFSKRLKIQRNFHALMICLSVFDLTYIVTNIMVFSMPLFSNDYLATGMYHHVMPWALPVAQIGMTGSIYFTMAMTIERYLVVCHPFYHHSHNWPTKYYIIPILCFCLLYNVPRFFEMEIIRLNINGTNPRGNISSNFTEQIQHIQDIDYPSEELPEYELSPTTFRLNLYYYIIYHVWLNFILMGLLPFVVLISLNTLMIFKLKEIEKDHRLQNGFNPSATFRARSSLDDVNRLCCKKDVAMAKVSLAIVFVFIICHSIRWLPNIYELSQIGLEQVVWPYWVECFVNLSHFLTTLNCSVNFFIYFAKHHRNIAPCGEEQPDLQLETMSDIRTHRASTTLIPKNCSVKSSLKSTPRSPGSPKRSRSLVENNLHGCEEDGVENQKLLHTTSFKDPRMKIVKECETGLANDRSKLFQTDSNCENNCKLQKIDNEKMSSNKVVNVIVHN